MITPMSWQATVRQNADAHVAALAPVIAEIYAAGQTCLRAIAAELTRRGMLTRHGGGWHVSTVCDLLARLESRAS